MVGFVTPTNSIVGTASAYPTTAGVPGLASNTFDFFRLLGDMDGDGTVDTADFDADGTIGTSDFSQFTTNFLHAVPMPLPN